MSVRINIKLTNYIAVRPAFEGVNLDVKKVKPSLCWTQRGEGFLILGIIYG